MKYFIIEKDILQERKISMNNLVEIKNNHVVVSTIQIADKFEKQHKDVLRLTSVKLRSSNGDRLSQHFFKTTYTDEKGEQRPMYLMDRDGFCFLVMGFTGEKADKWKLDFIDAFNAMEKKLNQQKQSTLAYDKYISLLDDKFMIGDIKSEPRVDITNPKFQEVLSEANRLLITLTVLIKDWNNKYMRCNDFRGYYSDVAALASKFVQIIVSISFIKFDTIPDEKFQPNEL